MKLLRELNQYRDRQWERMIGAEGDDTGGCFKLKSAFDGGELRIMVGVGEGWEHASVSRANRCPSWSEMEQVKRLFWQDNEIAMQLHVTPQSHISVHPYCLHIWRPTNDNIPTPPAWMVA